MCVSFASHNNTSQTLSFFEDVLSLQYLFIHIYIYMYKSIIGDDEIYLFYKYSCVTEKKMNRNL